MEITLRRKKIENMFTTNDFISHVVIFGDNRPFLVAVIFINTDYWKTLLDAEKREVRDKKLDRCIKKTNEKLSSIEKIKKFIMTTDKLDQKSGFLTPTMKIKRGKVYEKYKKHIEGLYN